MSASPASPTRTAAGASPNRARLESTGWKSTSASEGAQADMFTGIITDVGRVVAAEERGDLRLRIGCGYDMAGVDLGASIACSGVCLTVVDKGDDWFAVDVSHETLARSAPGLWAEGTRLHLQRSLR